MPRKIEDMDCDGLKQYCPLPEELQGIYGTPNGYYSCEGSCCKEAYKEYLKDTETCQICGEQVHVDDSQSIQVAADDICEPVCPKCMEAHKNGYTQK